MHLHKKPKSILETFEYSLAEAITGLKEWKQKFVERKKYELDNDVKELTGKIEEFEFKELNLNKS